MTHALELSVAAVGVAMFVGTIAAVVVLVRRIPRDYFVRPPPQHPLPVKIARNVLGGALIAAGAAMLVLPGQGLLTMLIGFSVLDLPIKHRGVAWLLRQPKVLEAAQAIRRKAGKPPLEVPPPASEATAES